MLMPKLKVADFYYGSVLSLLFNNHIVPALVEGNSDRQVYDLTTNQAEFRLFIKYRSENFPKLQLQGTCQEICVN